MSTDLCTKQPAWSHCILLCSHPGCLQALPRYLWLWNTSQSQPTQTLIIPVLRIHYYFPNHTLKHRSILLSSRSMSALHKIPHSLLPRASEQSFHLGVAFLATSDGTWQLPWWNNYMHVSRRDYPEALCVWVSLKIYFKQVLTQTLTGERQGHRPTHSSAPSSAISVFITVTFHAFCIHPLILIHVKSYLRLFS